MKAMVIRQYGGPEVFEPMTLPDPEAGAGEVRIRVAGSSLNPIETKIRSGLVQSGPEFPAVLNGDVVGIVDQVGEGVTHLNVGEAVMGCAGGVKGYPGALADYMIADARTLYAAPSRLPLNDVAALPLVFMTAWTALVERAQIKAGEQVLIHAGTGGVGHVAIQIAKAKGARVATTVSSQEKAELARSLGADDIIFYRDEAVSDYVERLTEGRGFDLVFDTVGGDNLDRSIEATAVSGRLCSINTRSTHDLSQLHAKNLTLHVIFRSVPLLHGIGMDGQIDQLRALYDLVETGKVKPLIDAKRFSYDDIAEAHRYLESGKAMGKVVLYNPRFEDSAHG